MIAKLTNIRLKNEPDARLKAISSYKDEFRLGMKESKDCVDKILADGEFNPRYGSWLLGTEQYTRIDGVGVLTVEKLQRIFLCDVEYIKDEIDLRIEAENKAKEEAFAWYELQSDEVKSKIDLIGRTKYQIIATAGYAG